MSRRTRTSTGDRRCAGGTDATGRSVATDMRCSSKRRRSPGFGRTPRTETVRRRGASPHQPFGHPGPTIGRPGSRTTTRSPGDDRVSTSAAGSVASTCWGECDRSRLRSRIPVRRTPAPDAVACATAGGSSSPGRAIACRGRAGCRHTRYCSSAWPRSEWPRATASAGGRAPRPRRSRGSLPTWPGSPSTSCSRAPGAAVVARAAPRAGTPAARRAEPPAGTTAPGCSAALSVTSLVTLVGAARSRSRWQAGRRTTRCAL
jgi:hypothetical protein